MIRYAAYSFGWTVGLVIFTGQEIRRIAVKSWGWLRFQLREKWMARMEMAAYEEARERAYRNRK